MTHRGGLVAIVLGCTAGCVGPGGFLMPSSPRAASVVALHRDGRAASAAGQAWLRAGDDVLAAPDPITTPVRRTTELGATAEAQAIAYRLTLPSGRRLSLAAGFEAGSPGGLFVDLFRLESGAAPQLVASLEPSRWSLIHPIQHTGEYAIRLQAEFGAAGRATIALRTLPSLPFPVTGLDDRRMRSGFGVARDAGRRQHEGIDIFAPRGSGVVAVADGVARAGANRLGGTVVWLYAPGEGRTFYYAHLDRAAVGELAVVRAGDVIGSVGNSGNARTTPPHLHFGIYDGGAIDPWPFVEPEQPVPRR
jgi:murein DD-endopeptidase MepM/ murein hydrolase activator NlpD